MTTDEATTLRIASLKRYAVEELRKAKTYPHHAHEHTLDALSAIHRAIELEDANLPIPFEVCDERAAA